MFSVNEEKSAARSGLPIRSSRANCPSVNSIGEIIASKPFCSFVTVHPLPYDENAPVGKETELAPVRK